ncbi:PAS domain-containing protein, partial [bacterium 1XD21-70]
MAHILLIILYLVTVGLSAYSCGWLLLRAERNGTTGALAACQLLVILWCIPQLFGGFPMTKGEKYLIYGISYLGISLIGPAWLAFSSLYCQKRPKRTVWVLLFGLSVLHYLAFLTNEYHHLFYRRFEADEVAYGQVFYIHMCYTYLCVLGGLAVVMREFRKKRVAALHMAVILLSAAVPLVFNILYISGLAGTPFDLTPLAFAISSFLMLLAVLRYDFLDVNALAFGQIFSSITEGVAVYNVRGTVVYCNQAAAAWLGIQAGDHFSRIRERLASQGLAVEEGRELLEEDAEYALEAGGRIRIRQYIRRSRNKTLIAGTFLLTDVGEYYERLQQSRELAVAAQRLAIEQERNRIAQEVHDTTGHTLTMVQSLLRLARVEWEKENARLVREEREEENARLAREEREEENARLAREEREEENARLARAEQGEENAGLARAEREEENAGLARAEQGEGNIRLANG